MSINKKGVFDTISELDSVIVPLRVFPRQATAQIKRLAQQSKAVAGPRQSGKTALVCEVFAS